MNDAAKALPCLLCPLLTGNGYKDLPESDRKCGYPDTRFYFLLHQLTMECHTGGACQPTVIYPERTKTEARGIMTQQRFLLHTHRKAA